jgi:hypothetical protein
LRQVGGGKILAVKSVRLIKLLHHTAQRCRFQPGRPHYFLRRRDGNLLSPPRAVC